MKEKHQLTNVNLSNSCFQLTFFIFDIIISHFIGLKKTNGTKKKERKNYSIIQQMFHLYL